MTLRDEIAMAICLAGCGIAAHRSDYYGEADAAIAAFRTWLDANGLVIVPRESTLEMDEVGLKEIQMAHNDGISVDAEVMWALMLSAAPDPLEPDKP
jgi:hypothetical protein